MKRLKLYYWYIGLPVLLVVLGSVVFFDAIMSTVNGNPHPQINYIIFALVVAGCYQMLSHVRRINHEGNVFRKYRRMVQNKTADEEVDALLKGLTPALDVLTLIQLVEGLRHAPLNSVQHSAVESELERFAARQARRLMLAQFMGGLMVGMGLLGTFIGLLGALAEIGKLIGSFNLGAGMTDPLATISELVARLTAPMQAMGVAFSASLFGVLGSLIIGVLMVGVRSASSDLVSFVQSDAWLMLELAPHDEGGKGSGLEVELDMDPLSSALGQLAKHSPLLSSLAIALDQSERRVRQLVSGMEGLSARIDAGNQTAGTLAGHLTQSTQAQERSMTALLQMQGAHAQLLEKQNQLADASQLIAKLLAQQNALISSAFGEQNQRLAEQMQSQQALWTAHSQQQLQLHEGQQSNWLAAVKAEGQHLRGEMSRTLDNQQASTQQMATHLQSTQVLLGQLAEQLQRSHVQQGDLQAQQVAQQQDLLKAMAQLHERDKTDTQSRAEMLTRIDTLLRENQFRNEQLVYFLSQHSEQGKVAVATSEAVSTGFTSTSTRA